MKMTPLSTPQLTDLAEQAERFMLMRYERQSRTNVLHNDSWALALAAHAREIALRRPGAGPDVAPLAQSAALLHACRHWRQGEDLHKWEDVTREFREWTGPDYLNANLALRAALPGGNGPFRQDIAEILHDARLAQRLLSGTEGAELTWLEKRYAGSPLSREAALGHYLAELQQTQFKSGELRRQYQHTHSAVLLDLQRLVDKLEAKGTNASSTSTAPASAPDQELLRRKTPKEVTELTDLERGPTRQAAQTYFRTVFRNHINLTSIADQKAAIMISVNTLLIGALVTFTSYRNWAETRPEVLFPVALFTVCGLVSLVYSVLAARPSGKVREQENLAFFGYFSQISQAEFLSRMEQQLQDPNALYGTLIKDLHGLGTSLQRKYQLLRLAYTIFLVGLLVSAVVLGLVIIW
ncbi:Pycsar system effector family protein [Neolewinella agarilytica]|uniref:Pycsar effector protein domain-containing protein n=1 Tax=Neolewinella agarilytica TaxID=478744 RepID=A0A1H9LHG3_9BACT|nr:Pycsar system effector family protein [Neolewinella agarilytica]SER10834.1 hypothetical protein SAMN05444359_12439 [Neolewinella agarilytica]